MWFRLAVFGCRGSLASGLGAHMIQQFGNITESCKKSKTLLFERGLTKRVGLLETLDTHKQVKKTEKRYNEAQKRVDVQLNGQ